MRLLTVRGIVVAAALAIATILAPIGVAMAETGMVILRVSGCDYYLISSGSGIVLAEWYGGYDPVKGDYVTGSFKQYGFKTLFFGPDGREGRAYIEDYSLSQDEALEKLSEQCQ
jgi:hypothetical protein